MKSIIYSPCSPKKIILLTIFVLGGCSSSGTSWETAAYVKASNTTSDDRFGSTVILSGDGNTMAVSTVADFVSITGAVYVYIRSGNGWSQQALLSGSNTEVGDNFGISIALSNDGNTLAVGAIGEDSNATGIDGDQADNSTSNSGAAYVFTRTGETWSQEAYVKASNPDVDDGFGGRVALNSDGNTLAVAAVGEDSNATEIDGNQTDNAASLSGAAYIFTRSGSTWSQQTYIKPSDTHATGGFGSAIALDDDGNTLAVGADQSEAGYVFTRTGSSWSEQAIINTPILDASDHFGASIALSGDGNTIAAGAYFEDSSATGINGDQSDNSATASGAVYVFARSGSAWTQEAYIKASNTGEVDELGFHSLALSGDGNILAAGSYKEDSDAIGIDGDQANDLATNSGAVYIFSRSGSAWTQQTYIKASNSDADDNFGFSFSLSNDGKTLAVGAPGEDSGATGVDGDQTDNSITDSGAVYLYSESS